MGEIIRHNSCFILKKKSSIHEKSMPLKASVQTGIVSSSLKIRLLKKTSLKSKYSYPLSGQRLGFSYYK